MDWPSRQQQIERLTADQPWDIVVVGGGATGLGIAVDAASRGYRVALLERHDFGKGTSSRSTKLIHGGVRYLQQGNVALVRESLRERTILCGNAPHLVHPQPFVIPLYKAWEWPYYRTGMQLYDWFAGKHLLEKSASLSRAKTIERLPSLRPDRLRGGVIYYDAAFDDARLLIDLAKTAIAHGAVCLNYFEVTELVKEKGQTRGVVARNVEDGTEVTVSARVVINATGPFVDQLRQADDAQASPIITPSQGIHIVLPREFFPGSTALIVPRTSDGRVMFAIPWHQHVLIGTTDTPIPAAVVEPIARDDEIEFLLRVTAEYLTRGPDRSDVLTVFTGIRPLVSAAKSSNTAGLSRSHTILVSDSGMITITGGKWTTYREMAEQCVDQAARLAELPNRRAMTRTLPIHSDALVDTDDRFYFYGNDADPVRQVVDSSSDFQRPLHERFEYQSGEVAWAVRREFARTVEDVLARRSRLLFLDCQAAISVAPMVAAIMAAELGTGPEWIERQLNLFGQLAEKYQCP